jgi:hypothetical protein
VGFATKIWSQGLWNKDSAVFILEVFDNCQPGSANREPGAIQCVDQSWLRLLVGPFKSDRGTTSLKIFEITA